MLNVTNNSTWLTLITTATKPIFVKSLPPQSYICKGGRSNAPPPDYERKAQVIITLQTTPPRLSQIVVNSTPVCGRSNQLHLITALVGVGHECDRGAFISFLVPVNSTIALSLSSTVCALTVPLTTEGSRCMRFHIAAKGS